MQIYFGSTMTPQRITYAPAKAIYLSEPPLGAPEKYEPGQIEWPIKQKQQGLWSLVSTYMGGRDEGKTGKDKHLERLLNIVKDGLVGNFILYEIASRMDPDIMHKYPEAARKLVCTYVRNRLLQKPIKSLKHGEQFVRMGQNIPTDFDFFIPIETTRFDTLPYLRFFRVNPG